RASAAERSRRPAAGHQRHAPPRASPAPAELAAELAEPELVGCLCFGWRRPPEEQTLAVLFREIEMHARGAEELERATHGEGSELVERLGRRDLLAELGQVLELADALSHLLVQ